MSDFTNLFNSPGDTLDAGWYQRVPGEFTVGSDGVLTAHYLSGGYGGQMVFKGGAFAARQKVGEVRIRYTRSAGQYMLPIALAQDDGSGIGMLVADGFSIYLLVGGYAVDAADAVYTGAYSSIPGHDYEAALCVPDVGLMHPYVVGHIYDRTVDPTTPIVSVIVSTHDRRFRYVDYKASSDALDAGGWFGVANYQDAAGPFPTGITSITVSTTTEAAPSPLPLMLTSPMGAVSVVGSTVTINRPQTTGGAAAVSGQFSYLLDDPTGAPVDLTGATGDTLTRTPPSNELGRRTWYYWSGTDGVRTYSYVGLRADTLGSGGGGYAVPAYVPCSTVPTDSDLQALFDWGNLGWHPTGGTKVYVVLFGDSLTAYGEGAWATAAAAFAPAGAVGVINLARGGMNWSDWQRTSSQGGNVIADSTGLGYTPAPGTNLFTTVQEFCALVHATDPAAKILVHGSVGTNPQTNLDVPGLIATFESDLLTRCPYIDALIYQAGTYSRGGTNAGVMDTQQRLDMMAASAALSTTDKVKMGDTQSEAWFTDHPEFTDGSVHPSGAGHDQRARFGWAGVLRNMSVLYAPLTAPLAFRIYILARRG